MAGSFGVGYPPFFVQVQFLSHKVLEFVLEVKEVSVEQGSN